MRSPAVLHIAAGVGVVLLLVVCLAGVEGTKPKAEKKEELIKPATNTIPKPNLLNFFRRLLPEKTLQTIRAAVTRKPEPKKKTGSAKTGDLKDKKKPLKVAKNKVVPVTANIAKKTTQASRVRNSVNPRTTTTNKVKVQVAQKVVKPPKGNPLKVKKQKTGKDLKSRQNSKTNFASFNEENGPAKEDMEILTHDQKRNRLRQELVRETEGNCLAKILCGTGGGTGSKPKPKEKNTLVSDTAYLIKEFFNIFDFTIDEVRDEIQEIDDVNRKAYEAEEAEKKKQKEKKKQEEEEEEEEDEEEDDADDEEDEIYRQNPVSDVQKKKKYTTRTPTSKQSAEQREKSETEKIKVTPAPVKAQPKTTRPKPVSPVEMTTVGDLVPLKKPSSTISTMDRLGEYVTPSSNMLTSTIMSTSMSGSATLTPVDMPFAIPLKTAKDDADDDEGDDEEDDNNKYADDNDEDSSTFHRVTLEELVGDIKLSPEDFEMIRRGRSMRQPRMKLSLHNVTNDKYIRSQLRQMKLVKSELKKLKIAQRVAKSMREPRQCRQFNQVAQQVLQTCPLTTEVIRFFNTNLKNGTSIEVKKIPPGEQKEGGGLVILKDNVASGSHQTYFVDNSPKSPATIKTKIQADLKNPSIPYVEEEDNYHVYEKRPNPNPQNANLNQHGKDVTKKPPPTTPAPPPKKPANKAKDESDEEQDDEGDSDEDDDDENDDVGRREGHRDDDDEEEEEEVEDDTGSREDEDEEYDDDGDDDDYDGSDDDSSNKQSNDDKIIKIKVNHDHTRIQGQLTNQPNLKVVIDPKTPKRPIRVEPTLPPGIIRVYGVPQPSFDRDFVQLPGIGNPVNLFGDEFLDSPPYRRRRPNGQRMSKNAKNDEDESLEAAENVAYNNRIPKHPPLEPDHFHDGDDDDDDGGNKLAYQNPKKHPQHNGGKPLGGVHGNPDVDDDDDDDKKVTSSEKKEGDDKDNSDENEPPVQISSIDESPFSPSLMYSVDKHPQGQTIEFYGGGGSPTPPQYASQVVQYHNQYHHHHHPQDGPVRRPHSYRPIVRPIQIMPDVNVPLTGVNFRPSRPMRPGRLYPIYGRK